MSQTVESPRVRHTMRNRGRWQTVLAGFEVALTGETGSAFFFTLRQAIVPARPIATLAWHTRCKGREKTALKTIPQDNDEGKVQRLEGAATVIKFSESTVPTDSAPDAASPPTTTPEHVINISNTLSMHHWTCYPRRISSFVVTISDPPRLAQ